MFGGPIAAIAIARRLGANAALTFWFAYILARPLGASLSDLISRSPPYGGLGWGTVTTSLVFFVVIAALVIGVSVRQDPHARRAAIER